MDHYIPYLRQGHT